MFWWFGRKKENKKLEEETKKGFGEVKKDIDSVGKWINHLDIEQKSSKKDIEEIKEILSTMNLEVEGIKNIVSVMNNFKTKQEFKTPKQVFTKQQGVYAVQTGVQTGVQTLNLDQFSITERALLWILLNSDLRLSYEDLSAMLGKERSTIRGQVNRIKIKGEGIIEEIIEPNGKKRVFIPEKIKEKLFKKTKVRLKREEK